jgi:hypothetical protein
MLIMKMGRVESAQAGKPELGHSFRLGLKKAAEMVDAARVPEFAQGLHFELTDALATHVVQIANFFQRVPKAIDEPKAHFEDRPFAFFEALENGIKSLFEHAKTGPSRRVLDGLVFYKITDPHLAVVANGGVERDGLAGHLK